MKMTQTPEVKQIADEIKRRIEKAEVSIKGYSGVCHSLVAVEFRNLLTWIESLENKGK